MQPINSINNFYEALKDISIINSNLDEKREELKKIVSDYQANTQKISLSPNLLNQNKELAGFLETSVNLLKESSYKWVEKFDALLEKEKFRSDLKNYFIIIIFGKVKAGKSSLGNFIAHNKPQQERVTFFKYDEAGEEQSIKKLEEIDEGFETNILECTITIQGFKLGGMAWIDTPGLGSMTPQNGALAKEYIQSADYIIYPTSSDSPLQADEISQINELFAQNKKVTICITKSDTKERKKDKEGKFIKKDGEIIKFLVNKPLENRTKQEEYVKTEIEKIIGKNKESLFGDIFSISSHTATKGLQDDDRELLENSNIPKFYELITDVVKTKSKRLKEEAPYDGLKSFIDNDILGLNGLSGELTIPHIKNSINSLDEKIIEILDNLDNKIFNIQSDTSSEIESVIAKYSIKIDKSNAQEIFKQIDKEIAQNISNIVEKNIEDIFSEFSYSLENTLSTFSENDFNIEDKHTDIVVTTTQRNKAIGASILGTIATIGAAVATGGASLLVTGAAAIATGVVGSCVGGKMGELSGNQHTERVNIGDNKEEVIQKFKERQMNIHSLNTHEIYKNIKESFFIPLGDVIKEMKEEMDKFESHIKKVL
ncbi:MAG: hypothetical protein KU28_03770 [Sulfurovum sp. PC08-66]|nr:MAG: hypothetical protein KU28_03770 [Sulfurovum sp. PC08-66]